MVKLSDIKEGKEVEICEFECGKRLKHRLCTLGIRRSQQIKILKNDKKGPLIIKVFDSKIALGRGQAQKINVELCNID